MTAFRLTCPSCQGTGVNWHQIIGPVGHDEPVCCGSCLGRGSVENEAFGQGRHQKGEIKPAPRWLWLLTGGAFLIVVTVILTGCVSPGPTREAMVCGQHVTYHPDDLKPCDGGSSACTIKRATSSAFNVYYSTADEAAVGHEEEHVCGMRHRQKWVDVRWLTPQGKWIWITCTVVTEGGRTAWKADDVMCRIDAGTPVKFSDARVRAYVLGGASR